MSIIDDISNTVHDVLGGNLGKALGDVGHTIHDVVGGGGGTPPGGASASTSIPNVGTGSGSMLSGIHGGIGGACTGTFVPPPPAMGSAATACCDRYQFNSGFLIDGATGTVWQYDGRSKSFEEVPVHRDKNKQALVDTLIETKLSALRNKYEQEVLATTPPASRTKLMATFEKEQLAPLREAAKATQY